MTLSHQEIATAARLIALGSQPFLYSGNLNNEIGVDQTPVALRDYIRQTFFDLGIEIEFSGKNEYEKGVIIDIDEDKIKALGLNNDALRFGQTVVKAITL